MAGNIFQRPKANILFIIEGLEKGTALPFSGKMESYRIVKKEADSYLDIVRISPIRSFISHIWNILQEKPLVISFSAENQFPQAASVSGVNSHTVTWDSKEQSFKDSELSLDMAMSKTELLKKFEKSGFGEDVKYRKDDREFVVSVPGLKEIVFDMNQVEDFLFFAELEMIVHLHDKVKTLDDLLHDDYPDFFTFGISSLKGLVHRYGNNSKQVVAALHVLNNFIPQISSLFSQLYGGQALIEVVNLQRNKIGLHEKFPTETNDIYEYLQDHLSSSSLENFKDNLPAVNLRENLEQHAMDHLCNSVRSRLFAMQSKLEVICGDVNDESHSRTRRDISRQNFVQEKNNCTHNDLNLAALDDYYDGEFPAIFNISLWLMIAIALGLYVVCLVLWYMDPGRDSIIYRVTSQRMKTE